MAALNRHWSLSHNCTVELTKSKQLHMYRCVPTHKHTDTLEKTCSPSDLLCRWSECFWKFFWSCIRV